MNHILLIIIQILITPFLSPLAIGVVRKIKARMQNRTGASVFQPYRDILKLFYKNEAISRNASWIFLTVPYMVFAITLVIGASIPLLGVTVAPFIPADFLTIIYLFALGTFLLALAAIDVGSGFGGFGASREMTMSAITEGGLLFSILPLVLFAQSSNLQTISSFVATPPGNLIIPLALAGLAYILSMLAECARFPFDNPATHLELTMIHEAMILEYSGKKLALMEWAAANKFFIFLIIGANIFMPWTPTLLHGWQSVVLSVAIVAAKVIVFAVGVALLESSIAKYRFFRLPDLLFGSFVLGVVAIGLTL